MQQDTTRRSRKAKAKLAAPVALATMLLMGGCAQLAVTQVGPQEAPIVQGPPVRDNRTPLDGAFACYAQRLGARVQKPIAIGVGEVRDYTGKYSDTEGNQVTQGGSLMVISALAKLGNTVRLHERFDTRVAELELAYIDRKQLGDGGTYQVPGQPGTVPWLPYFGGSILRSDYFIVGGITELNWNIQSGGAEVRIGGIGPKARVFTLNVAVDLRIVNTQNLVIEGAVSLQKQITGLEVGFEVFRFFDDELYDVNIGTKQIEPMQLGIRTTLEQGVLELLAKVSGAGTEGCLPTTYRIERIKPSAPATPQPSSTPTPVAAPAAMPGRGEGAGKAA
jgi:curli biogenesis system outer membrane secretion channel CsgG